MGDVEGLLGYVRATDELLEHAVPTWWGAVISDTRFPLLWDANYARVEALQPDLSLADVMQTLEPALRHSGSGHAHVLVFRPEGTPALLQQAELAGHRLSWQTAMRCETALADGDSSEDRHVVEEADSADETLWEAHSAAYDEFEVESEDAAEQLLRLTREVLTPAGRRCFVVRNDDRIAGMASLQIRAGVGYVDDVVTFPDHRRRGMARALVRRTVEEARAASVADVFLLAERTDAIRLYESVGFRAAGEIVSSLGPLPSP